MPTLSIPINAALVTLKQAYEHLNSVEKFFFPSKVKEALVNISTNVLNDTHSAWKVYQAVQDRNIHRSSFKCLRQFSDSLFIRISTKLHSFSGEREESNFNTVAELSFPERIDTTLSILLATDLLKNKTVQQTNFNAIFQHRNTLEAMVALQSVANTSLLTGDAAQANFNAIFQHHDPKSVAKLLVNLHTKTQLLTGEYAAINRSAIAQHDSPADIETAIRDFDRTYLLTKEPAQTNFEAIIQHQNPSDLAYALNTMLRPLGYLSNKSAQANFNSVVHHQTPKDVAYALQLLDESSLLNTETADDNRKAITQHTNPVAVAYALKTLHTAKLLVGEAAEANRNTVATHKNPQEVAQALTILARAGLLSDKMAENHREAIANHHTPTDLAMALESLRDERLLTPANCNAVAKHQDPLKVTEALNTLGQAQLLTGDAADANRNAVAAHKNPQALARALVSINREGLLTGDAAEKNRKALSKQDDPEIVAFALKRLQSANLLTDHSPDDNREAVAQHTDPEAAAEALIELQATNLLTGNTAKIARDTIAKTEYPARITRFIQVFLPTPEQFDALIRHSEVLFSTEIHDDLLNIPVHIRIPHEDFDRIIALCNAQDNTVAERQERVHDYIRGFLRLAHPTTTENGTVLNTPQSTHTASVHTSTDLTAWVLSLLYPTSFSFEKCEALLNALRAIPESYDFELFVEGTALQPGVVYLKEAEERLQGVLIAVDGGTITNANLHYSPDIAFPINIKELNTTALKQSLISFGYLIDPKKKHSAIRCLERLEKETVRLEISDDKKRACLALFTYLANNDDALRLRTLKHRAPTRSASASCSHADIKPASQSTLVEALENEPFSDSHVQLNTFINWLWMETKGKSGSLTAWVDALYEIQRGYNLNEQGQDLGDQDLSICYGGTANKLCERLTGLSENIFFTFVTEASVSLKLQTLCLEALAQYCKTLLKQARLGDASQKQAFSELLSQLKTVGGLEKIVSNRINFDTIAQQLADEFGPTFNYKKLVTSFKANCLPYLPTIDAAKAPNIYPPTVLSQLKALVMENTPQTQQHRFFDALGIDHAQMKTSSSSVFQHKESPY